MQLYLTIITTVLVLTQIIRVSQNAMQLRHLGKVHKYDDYIKKVYEKLEIAIDTYLCDCETCKYEDCSCEDYPCNKCQYCSYYVNKQDKYRISPRKCPVCGNQRKDDDE